MTMGCWWSRPTGSLRPYRSPLPHQGQALRVPLPALLSGRGSLDGSPSACGVTGREPGGTRPRQPGGPYCRPARTTSREI
ncbi:MAG TPA: hypothetical protein VFN02_14895 [Ktedonobacteraceae bacterium]|nr:hypothetical protein [Ktedonobacteraceae bacterium]